MLNIVIKGEKTYDNIGRALVQPERAILKKNLK
jgi:hypothetical protein